jgi:hypothetical protein
LDQQGKGLIGATVLVYLGIAMSIGIYQYYNRRAITFLRGFLVAGIYRKTTLLNLSSDNSKASVTLMSTDAERIQEGCRDVHELWVDLLL